MSTVSTLPKIITVLSVNDHGPCDGGATATCPHCGADGRYVYIFLCEDGVVRGAMKGCIQLFPKHPFAMKVAYIFEKQATYAKKQWRLASWDEAIIEAVQLLAAKTINIYEWENRVRLAFAHRDIYRSNRGRR